MLISAPLLTVVFLSWVQNRRFSRGKINQALLRVMSATMYNVHPLFLAVFALVVPGLDGLWAFLLCTLGSAGCGWMLYSLRNLKFFSLLI